MRPLHYLVFFLTFLGLSSCGASTLTGTSQSSGDVIITTGTSHSFVNPIIESHPQPDDDKISKCQHKFLTFSDIDHSRIESAVISFLQRHFNFHWFFRRSLNTGPPLLQVEIQDFCHPSIKYCQHFVKILPEVINQAVKDVNYWLYTTPYNGSYTAFCPMYPRVARIHVLIGADTYWNEEVGDYADAYVPREMYPGNTKRIYINGPKFDNYTRNTPRWAVDKWAQSTITHEIVHVLQHGLIPMYQWQDHTGAFAPIDCFLGCHGYTPLGLIEGIADFVALKAGEPAPHWPERPRSSRRRPIEWDDGYIGTAYFLEWLENKRIGHGAIGRLNDRIGKVGYFHKTKVDGPKVDRCPHHSDTWKALFGSSIEELWDEYVRHLDERRFGRFGSYFVDFVTNQYFLLVFVTLLVGWAFFPYVHAVARETDLATTMILGARVSIFYLGGFIASLQGLTFGRVWSLLTQMTLHGALAMVVTFLILVFDYSLVAHRSIPPLDVAFFGCVFGVLFIFMFEFSISYNKYGPLVPVERTEEDDDSLWTAVWRGRRATIDARLINMLGVVYGVYVVATLWILHDGGIALPVIVAAAVFLFAPLLIVDIIVTWFSRSLVFCLRTLGLPVNENLDGWHVNNGNDQWL